LLPMQLHCSTQPAEEATAMAAPVPPSPSATALCLRPREPRTWSPGSAWRRKWPSS
jgi:hypothetical protein